MHKKKRLVRYILSIISFLLFLNISYALPYIYMTDDWYVDAGSDNDEGIFVDYSIFPDILGITDADADMICYDWNDDESYDNCYWDSDGCGSSCNANSCDYYAVPYDMPDDWKAGCNIDSYGGGNCTIGKEVNSRICSTCDGVDTSTQQRTYIDAVVYYDCDNSNTNRHGDSLNNDDFFVVKPKKYDCDDGAATDYDYEGDSSTGGGSWADIKWDISCGSTSLDCDENHDDSLVYTATGSISSPCRTKNGYSCTVNDDCISDHCVHGTCRATDPYCGDNYCDSGEVYSGCPQDCCDNDCTGYSDAICRSVCDGYGGCSFFSTSTKSACNGVWWNDPACVDADTYVTCCEGTPVDCASNPKEYCTGGYCIDCSTSCDDSCQSSACYLTDPDCDSGGSPTLACCGNGACDGSETCSSCSGDCGTCGTICGNNLCEAGETCASDNCCSGNTVNFNTDESNCGSCGSQCSAGQICQQGVCTSCGGSIQAIVTDSANNVIENAKVYFNNVYNGTTDAAGKRDITVSSSTCGQTYEIEIRCTDDTFCNEKTTTIDYNGDADSLAFTCNICTNEPDLYIDDEDVYITDQSGSTNITVTVHSVDISATNLKVNFKKINSFGVDTYTENKTLVSMSSGQSKNVSVLWNISSDDAFVKIYVDPDNLYAETNPSNNEITKALNLQTNIYLEIKTEFSKVNDEIQNYLKDKLKSDANFVSDLDRANITIAIGTNGNSQLNSYNGYTLSNLNWGYKSKIVQAYGKQGISPYNGIVGSFYKDGKARILIYGTEIEGTVAAVKKFIEKKSYFLNNYQEDKDALYLERENIDAIRIFDFMHTLANENYYRQNNDTFSKIVSDALNDNFGELHIKDVIANDNTVLRVKQVASEMSANYRNWVNDDPNPVVLARGLWSNLLSWEDFGRELVRDGRDAWLIEITGGPNQEFNTSPNYNYTTLKTLWWPALIAGVQGYSESNNLSYVGFSNGCRVALSSLEMYDMNGKPDAGQFINNSDQWQYKNLTPNPINTFIGVGCPGAFEGESAFSISFGAHGNDILNHFIDHNITHFTGRELGLRLEEECAQDSFINRRKCTAAAISLQEIGENRISRGLGSAYLDFITDPDDSQPGYGLQIPELLIIYGQHPRVYGLNLEQNSDGVVTREDAEGILEAVNATTENIEQIEGVNHIELVDDRRTENLIIENLR